MHMPKGSRDKKQGSMEVPGLSTRASEGRAEGPGIRGHSGGTRAGQRTTTNREYEGGTARTQKPMGRQGKENREYMDSRDEANEPKGKAYWDK